MLRDLHIMTTVNASIYAPAESTADMVFSNFQLLQVLFTAEVHPACRCQDTGTFPAESRLTLVRALEEMEEEILRSPVGRADSQ
ncbi:uncharacterized protein ARMOST_02712 [Armillaria ostoyae]|uniref:Uncharacterized protein n=1 Tax=Armillaria ostoyae TaxID=47428 RepID=A0A284QSN0_ARMOS|nr:uncharacterized protein ARMOST_02712 [Armillaria ostoyae]